MKRLRESSNSIGRIIKVNAGGMLFVTLYETLTKSFPDCVLAKQFSELSTIPQDSNGHYFIDMNPLHFAIVLDIMRHPKLLDIIPKDIPIALFNTLINDQELRPSKPQIWEDRHLAIQEAWKEQCERDAKLDRDVLDLILGWIDLPALILSPEISKTIYLPINVYMMRDDSGEADLPIFISDSLEELQCLLDQVSDNTAKLSIENGSQLEEKPVEFVFQEVTYKSVEKSFYALTITVGC